MMLYLHIPFCVRKCPYCDFVSYPGQESSFAAYVDALLREMDRRVCGEEITSVFFGGGTPSLLLPQQFSRLLEGIRAHYTLASRCEITSECNPGTVTETWLEAAAEGGVNRLSVGIQAAQERLLQSIGRIHSYAQAKETFCMARKAGISNLSADLMYALPGQTVADWEDSLHRVLELEPKHLSCYALTVAQDTPFGALEAKGQLPRPTEDEEMEMQEKTADLLEQNGLFQYEVSNYAKPGYASRHNIGYWTRADYIGLGCAAHSKEGNLRLSNVCGLAEYLKGADFATREELSPEEEQFEELMLGLRLKSGIKISHAALVAFRDGMEKYEKMKLLHRQGNYVRLTESGYPVMNSILSDLL